LNKQIISQKLQDIFQELFNNDQFKINNDLCANDLNEWDSLTNVMLFVEIEKSFSIRFKTSEITSILNVGELISSILAKIPSNN